MTNHNISISQTNLEFSEPFEVKTSGQSIDVVDVLYAYLFNDNVSLKDRNKILLLFLQDYISRDDVTLIHRVLDNQNAFYDIHVSFLKAMLMMTENVSSVKELRNKLLLIYNERMSK